ncbi:MAG: helix-turn-helix transcriptional regulator [Vibrio sp.]
MPHKPTKQESLLLAFELLKRIPKNSKITAKELHQQLSEIGVERDLRTIQRNLELLCEHFDIVKDDRSKPYGYQWLKESDGFSLPKLSAQEALLLNLAEEYLFNLLPSNVVASLNTFFQEAKSKLDPVNNNQKERDWLKKVRIVSDSMPLLPPKIESEVFTAISEALYNNRLLNIDYHNAKQEQKSSTVMPLGLAQQGQRLYLVCRFDGFDNERSLSIHRITKATVSTFNFERPKDFRLSQYDADGRFGFGEGERCQLSFCISKQNGFYLTETPLSEDQKVIEVDDENIRIQATVVKSQQLDKWLLGFGDRVWDLEIIPINNRVKK